MEVDVRQLLSMHSDNTNRANQQDARMLSIEQEQKKQNETLSGIAVTLARIDERTSKFPEVKQDVDRAAGASKVAIWLGGTGILGEIARIIFHK